MPRIYDRDGIERSEEWLKFRYGPVEFSGEGKFKLVEVREATGYSTCLVKVLDKDGQPIVGHKVAWYWPGATVRPDCGYLGRCDIGFSKETGTAEFPMSGDSKYYPPNIGPYGVWMYGGDSTMVLGIGMIGSTNHDHLDLTYQEQDEVEPPPPPPPPPPPEEGEEIQKALAKLDSALEDILEAKALLESLL